MHGYKYMCYWSQFLKKGVISFKTGVIKMQANKRINPKARLLIASIIILVALASIILILGLKSGNTYKYAQKLDYAIDSPSRMSLILKEHPDIFALKSLKLSGSYKGSGNYSIYLNDESGNRYLAAANDDDKSSTKEKNHVFRKSCIETCGLNLSQIYFDIYIEIDSGNLSITEISYVLEDLSKSEETSLTGAAIAETEIESDTKVDDSFLQELAPNTNHDQKFFIRVGVEQNIKKTRGVIRFNLSSIPEGTDINSAQLRLFFFRIPGADSFADKTHSVHRILPGRNWSESTVTWNSINSTDFWSSPGGDFNPNATDSVIINSQKMGFIYWNVTKDVQYFISTGNNFGWVIKEQEENESFTRRDYRSSEYFQNPSQRPALIINFSDLQAPRVRIIEPLGEIFSQSQPVNITANVTDNINISAVYASILFPNSSSQLFQLFDYNGDSIFNNTVIDTNATGIYNITIIASDDSGNINSTEKTFFIIKDTAPPIINSANASPDNVDPGNIINITANVTDNVAVDAVIFELIDFNSSKINYTMSGTGTDIYFFDALNTTMPSGLYFFTIYANDTSGNSAAPKTGNFTINSLVSISLKNTPINFSTSEAGFIVNASVSQGFPLIINNTGNVNANITIYGLDLIGQDIPSYFINITNVLYSFNQSNISTALDSTPVFLITLNTSQSESIFFRLMIPLGTLAQQYHGNVTLSAVQT